MALFARATLITGALGGPSAACSRSSSRRCRRSTSAESPSRGRAGCHRRSCPAVRASKLDQGSAAGWSGGTLTRTVRAMQVMRAVPAEVRADRAPLMAVGVLALAAMALVTAMGGAGG